MMSTLDMGFQSVCPILVVVCDLCCELNPQRVLSHIVHIPMFIIETFIHLTYTSNPCQYRGSAVLQAQWTELSMVVPPSLLHGKSQFLQDRDYMYEYIDIRCCEINVTCFMKRAYCVQSILNLSNQSQGCQFHTTPLPPPSIWKPLEKIIQLQGLTFLKP